MDMKNILVIKLSAIGDVIHALPVSHAIKETYPDARVTWVVEPPAYDLLVGNPCIDRIILFEKKKFKSWRGFIKNIPSFSSVIREERYDAVLDLQGLGKSAAIAVLAKAPLKVGCCNMREGSHLVCKPVCGAHQGGHIVERYLDVARSIGCEVKEVVFPLAFTAKDETVSAALMRQAGMDPQNSYAVFAVGANWPNKRWPAKYYAQLAEWLYDKKIIPVLVGGGSIDAQIAGEIHGQAKIPPVDLIGKTNLKQLAWTVKHAAFLVGGDTGPMHLAAALKTPVVALMGPTDSNRNGPYGQQERAIEIDLSCKYCWKRSCKLGRDCLAAISPVTVEEKILQILNNK